MTTDDNEELCARLLKPGWQAEWRRLLNEFNSFRREREETATKHLALSMSNKETLVGHIPALTPQDHLRRLLAERTLESLGYTYSEGSSMGGVWEPPKASLPENEAVYPTGPADRFIVRAFYERTEIPGVFHLGYPESAPTFAMNVMARAAQLQASEGGSTDERP